MSEIHPAQLDAMRAALKDACDLLEGWVLTKCSAKYRGEHMQHIQQLRKAGQNAEPAAATPLQKFSVVVTWNRVSDVLPDDDRMVQLCIPEEDDPDVTPWFGWLGWYEHEDSCWMTSDGRELPDGKVIWWAEATPIPTGARS